MSINLTLLDALSTSLKYEPALTQNRIKYLNSWFNNKNSEKFLLLYNNLADDESKKTLLKLLYNNVCSFLAGDREEFKYFSQQEWGEFKRKAALLENIVPSYSLDVVETYILEGYAYRDICKAEAGDIVLDCGAFTGNTALYFSEKVGSAGKVYAFEPITDVFNKLQENIAKFSKNNNIFLTQAAVSSKSGKISFLENQAASKAIEGNGVEYPALAIDDFMSNNNLKKVDFIKMDVEGSENLALEGARKTIAKYSPKLAICIYHLCDDYITIPEKILSINPNYRFYIKHNDRGFGETVLFAMPAKKTYDAEINYSDAKLNSALWESLKSMQSLRQKERRRRIMENYNNKILHKLPFLGYGIFSPEYTYLYYPLSDDDKLHYEFLFSNEKVKISLHFEGKYKYYTSLIKEISEASKISIPLNIAPIQGKGVSYLYNNLEDYDKIAELMSYLAKISLPVLARERLLPDRILLNMPASVSF